MARRIALHFILSHRERTRKLYELLKAEMRLMHLELSVTGSGKEGKSKLDVSNPHLRQRRKGFDREHGLGMDSSIECLGIDIEDRQQRSQKKTGVEKKSRYCEEV